MFCFCCNCCCDPFKFAFLSAIICGIEALCFATLNVCLIFIHTCVIEPPYEDTLTAYFIKEDWAWFFYDRWYCEKNQGPNYQEPVWINIIKPESWNTTNTAYKVTPSDNFSYQITYAVFHLLWFFSALVLIYGNARKQWKYYIPWMTITMFLISFDIAIGAIYIKLMDDVNAGWTAGQAIFSMQFLYLRGFILLILNIVEFCNVLHAFCLSYRKRTKQKKKEIEIRLEVQNNQASQTAVASQECHNSNDEIIHYRNVPQQTVPIIYIANPGPNLQHQDSMYASNPPPISSQQIQPSAPYQPVNAPEKLRPFSYMNPAYRPSDHSDLQGMQSNKTGSAYENLAMEGISYTTGSSIPRATLTYPTTKN